MFNFCISCDNGTTCIIRAQNKKTAVMLFCKAEGCSEEWYYKYCTTKKMKEV